MDQRQTPMTLALVGVLAGGIAAAAFLMLLVVGGFALTPAVFLAALIGLVVAIVLYVGFHKAEAVPAPTAHAAPKPKAAPAPAMAAAPAVVAAPAPVAAPVAAPSGQAARPAGLAAPEGAADDLKQIKGVGPKLEKMLNGMGYWHFRQIAAWTAAEIAWVDENLEGFKGRVTRDDWVPQARVLAGGGTTDFADKVKDGEIY